MNLLMHGRHAEPRVVRSPSVGSDTEKAGDVLDDDNVDELDPVDYFLRPPARARPRRRFVKSGVTTYELSFSRRPARRIPTSKDDLRDDQDADTYHPALPGAYRPTPVVSSLSSVMSEVMTGKTQALNNIIDTTPPQPNVTYVVEHASDGTPYVAASDGNRYFENSTIGQIFLHPVSSQSEASAQQWDLDFLQSGGRNHQHQSTSSLVLVDGAMTSCKHLAESEVDGTKGSKALNGSHQWSKKEKRLVGDLMITQDKDAAMQDTDNKFSVLNLDKNRTDSCREVAAPPTTLQEAFATVPLLEAFEMSSAEQARIDFHVNADTASTSSSSSATKLLPRLHPKTDLPAPPLACDEDDNPLCRSFQNIRDVDARRSSTHSDEEEHELNDDAAGDDYLPDATSPDFTGRVRVSSGATSVAEFVGGFKGQLARRSGANGLIHRKRAVRHARLTAEEQKAADLAKKLREARHRIPLEFRDESLSPAAPKELQTRKKARAASRHVHFNTNVLVREFEVESEEEGNGYNSPDEIVDAVQLVSKRDVVNAEDVVAVFPMEELGLPLAQHEPIAHGFPSILAIDYADEATKSGQNSPLTFSQLKNDKRMSFSEL